MTTDRGRISVVTEKQRNRWFSPEKAPTQKSKPDLLDPAVNPKTAFPDSAITSASPEFDGPALDLKDQK